MIVIARKYGVQTTIPFSLWGIDGADLKVDAAHASGDTTITKDEGAPANTTNGFTDEGNGYAIVLTATEMQAARIHLFIIDQGTKAWLDREIVIETYGHASALHTDMPPELGSDDRVLISADDVRTLAAANYATASAVQTIDDILDTEIAAILSAVDTEIAAILADTNELQTDLVNGGRLDLLIDAIKAKTDQLVFTVANMVDANIQRVNDVAVTGDGQSGTEWGPA